MYSPFIEKPTLQDTVPVDAPVVGTVTTTVHRNGTFETDSLTIPEAVESGVWFVWHETIAATDTTLDWNAQFGVASEMSMVEIPEIPTPFGGFSFTKTDSVNHFVVLEDAVFGLFTNLETAENAAENTEVYLEKGLNQEFDENFVAIDISDEQGLITFDNLEAGTFWVVELLAPENYTINPEILEATGEVFDGEIVFDLENDFIFENEEIPGVYTIAKESVVVGSGEKLYDTAYRTIG